MIYNLLTGRFFRWRCKGWSGASSVYSSAVLHHTWQCLIQRHCLKLVYNILLHLPDSITSCLSVHAVIQMNVVNSSRFREASDLFEIEEIHRQAAQGQDHPRVQMEWRRRPLDRNAQPACRPENHTISLKPTAIKLKHI